MRRLGNLLLILLVVIVTFCAVTPSLAQASAWQPNTPYTVNALVSYGGSTYKCLQAHTSQLGWEPPNVPALWQLQVGTPIPATNTPTKTNTIVGPTVTRTTTPTSIRTDTPTATSSGGCAAPAWNSTAVYTNGNQVSYGGHLWQAKWWTRQNNFG